VPTSWLERIWRNENPEILLQSALRFFKFLPGEEKQMFLHHVTENVS
jgi:hypothetical protein